MFDHEIYCLIGEEWRDIPDYEGIYQASSFGRIRTVDGKQTHSDRHGIRTWKGRILKSRGANPVTGYRVTLWKNKKPKDALVARLVGMAFLGVPDDLSMTINHKDGDRFNNNISNLEWLTLADNVRHAFDTGLQTTCRPVKLSFDGKIHQFRSMSEAARFIGRNHGYVSLCIQKQRDIRSIDGKLIKIV